MRGSELQGMQATKASLKFLKSHCQRHLTLASIPALICVAHGRALWQGGSENVIRYVQSFLKQALKPHLPALTPKGEGETDLFSKL